MPRSAFAALTVVAASCLLLPLAFSQDAYPNKPVRVVVPYSIGGAADVAMRAYAQGLTEFLGVQFVVDNKPSGGSNLAASLVAHAPADGYTLYMANLSSIGINKYLYKELGYDPDRDFAAVSMLARGGMFLIVNLSLPASVKEFVQLAQQRPKKLSYASNGIGSASHIVSELFRMHTNVDAVHVPYKGAAEANRDILGGRIDYMFDTTAMALVHAGKLRALAVAYTERWPSELAIPSMAELGYPGVSLVTFYALVAPARTPVAILDKLSVATRAVAQRPVITSVLAVARQLPFVATRQETAAFLREQSTKWGPVVKSSGAKVD
jgi:tripartite-type tricarboxylate transporter receptor subunit TctC